ncbi:HGxxPAAW family protein [Tessaracoccus sp. OH4464_COT-324]|uniref:HGxxPAAW family protein n=1 Tax=Tessaracoccus sp. OH4464_COT-324 TaxID=2491059 RepID=UPI00131A28D0|nr:HGxxPAAW family protein [Tessaracoccus sp. OH4464_COT-324]
MARQARYYHHGQSPAAWTGTVIAVVGFLAVTVGIFMGPSWLVVWVGAAIIALSAVVTLVMKAMGLGQP